MLSTTCFSGHLGYVAADKSQRRLGSQNVRRALVGTATSDVGVQEVFSETT